MGDLTLEDIIIHLAKSESDSKLTALASLKNLLLELNQLPEESYDGLTLGIKSSLRQPNIALSTAALVVLPRYIALITGSASPYQHLLLLSTSLLPPGHGLVDRLGDSNPRTREAAKDALVELGILAFKEKAKVAAAEAEAAPQSTSSTSKQPAGGGKKVVDKKEPWSDWEEAIKSQGLVSKNAKIREASVQIIGLVRSNSPLLRLSFFTAKLVTLLEDGDGQVRETTRASVIAMFSTPSTPPKAKADLKKQLLAQGTRKAFRELIVSQVLGDPATHVRAAATDQGMQDVPLIEEDIELEIVYIASVPDLQDEFRRLLPAFDGAEDENNWAGREVALETVRGMLLGNVFVKHPVEFVACLRAGFMDGTLKSLASLRTSVFASTCDCYIDLITHLGTSFDPLVDTILLPLSSLATNTKSVIVKRTQKVVETLLRRTSCPPRLIIPFLTQASQYATRSKMYGPLHLKTYLDIHGTKSKHAIENFPGGLNALDRIVKDTLVDADTDVKKAARPAFWSYQSIWPEAGARIMASLDRQATKALEETNPEKKKPRAAAPKAPKRASVMAQAVAARREATRQQEAEEAAAAAAAAAEASHPSSPPPTSVPLPPSSPPAPLPSSRHSHSSPPPPTVSSSYSSPSGPIARSTPVVVARATSPPARSPHRPFVQPQRAAPSSPFGLAQHSPTPKSLRAEAGRPVASMSDQSSLMSQEELVSPLRSHQPHARTTNFDPSSSTSTPARAAPPEPLDFMAETPNQFASSDHQPVPEEEIRSQAEQAVSTAQRLTEVDEQQRQEERYQQEQARPLGNGAGDARETTKENGRHVGPPSSFEDGRGLAAAQTPVRNAMRGAAAFQNSPQVLVGSPMGTVDFLKAKGKGSVGGWRKKLQNLDNATPPPSSSPSSPPFAALEALASGSPSLIDFQALLHFSDQHSSASRASVSSSSGAGSSASPLSEEGPMSPWGGISNQTEDALRKTFESLLGDLSSDTSPPHLEVALYLLEALLENQKGLVVGHENTVCLLLWKIRSAGEVFNRDGKLATYDVFIALLTNSDASFFLLNTVANSLRSFLQTSSDPDKTLKGHSFGLLALGLCCMELPAEIIEEVLPKLQDILLPAFLSTNLPLRQFAAIAITGVQLVLRDDTLLFTLLDGLSLDNKNFLTYQFDKYKVREGSGEGGREKVGKEFRRMSLG